MTRTPVLIRNITALAISLSLVGATAITASAAPKDNKAELLTAASTLTTQAARALYLSGGSTTSCKPWAANSEYVTAARTSANFVRALAGLPKFASNSDLNSFAGAYTHNRCSSSTPAQAVRSVSWKLVPGDPGAIRSTLNSDASGRRTVLSTSAANFAVGFNKSAYSNVATEYNFFSSNSTGDYLTNFSKHVSWPSAGYFPVELSNGIWSFFAKNSAYTDADFDEAVITVKNVATGANVPVEKLETSSWRSSYDQLHFKVPGAKVGTAKGAEASYEVTISNSYTGYGSSKVVQAPIKYTVKLVRTGATFKYTPKAPVVVKQPASKISVKVNDYIKIGATIRVPNQQESALQWQYKRPGQKTWNSIIGAREPSASVTPQGISLNGSSIRLRAESAGKTIYTKTIAVKVTKYASTVSITKATLKRGKKPVVTVKASQAGKVTVTAVRGKTKISTTKSVAKNKAKAITLPKAIAKASSAKGKWKVTVKFTPSKSNLYAGKTATKTITVK